MANKNIITVLEDGPLQVEGDFRIYDTVGRRVECEEEDKAMLCRCGASKNKPLCDGSHVEAGFKHSCKIDNRSAETLEPHTMLIISCRPNGMLVAKGPMVLVGSDGQTKVERNKAALCRCGESRSKPFCDATHKKIGFVDDALMAETDGS